MKLRLISTSLLFSLCYASSPEQKFSELQDTLFDTYQFELRRRELRDENRTRATCTQPTESLSYRMINYLTGIVDRADGLSTTETIWNPNPELCEWEMLQNDEWALIENRHNEWDDIQWQEKKLIIKTTGALIAVPAAMIITLGFIDPHSRTYIFKK
jgi:hypothetical protein